MAGLVPFNRRNDQLLGGFGDLRNMLDDFFTDTWPIRRSLQADTFKIDVEEKDKEYVVEAELPGAEKKDIQLAMEDGRLTIAVQKEENIEEKDKNYIHRERRVSSMRRCVMLNDAETTGIKAKLDNGILSIHVPKKEQADNTQQIEIE